MMPSFVSSDSFLIRNVDYPMAGTQEGQDQPPAHRLFQALSLLGQRFLGCVCLLFGGALVLTLLLMPLGLPVFLLGVALIAAPADV